MTNLEKYRDSILGFGISYMEFGVSKYTNKPILCDELGCEDCRCKDATVSCQESRRYWLNMDYEENEEIKRCPFCGSTASYRTYSKNDGQCSYKVGYISCNNDVCGCSTPKNVLDGYYGMKEMKKEDVIKIWNRRPEYESKQISNGD